MKRKRVDEYHKNGYHFYGHLVVVEYSDDCKNARHKCAQEAADFVTSHYGKHETLLTIPEYVARLKS